ncbi:S8 family serine peptidase [Parachryseolinea silvisoli]|uniref:S8 family serine peptidase n=1 Tax=Parachryseolinea silvisoli TaxID=2873601 RepID=UPI002265C764|nr:S8 family serine peptidase [Parachryseolinea silvisoli]MCD9016080.1 S8 family serine peptidase [Parachryseolinea silvisoli]
MQQFSWPAGIRADDYIPGKVLVKVRPEYKAVFQNPAGRMSLGGSIRPLVPPNTTIKNKRARAQAFMPAVDIQQYFEITFDPNRPVDDFINELYATGYIDVAEPVYRQRLLNEDGPPFDPNDEEIVNQYYLTNIRAYEAWGITQGSEDVIIAIVDSGVDTSHPDLAPKLYINEAEYPPNGVDDDHNGYIDDYRGWDFSGPVRISERDPSFIGDNDPTVPKAGVGFSHGTQVGGVAAAATNNVIGISGVGFNAKLLFTKHYADNQPSTEKEYDTDTFQGIVYAARQGARIINCSWGSYARSQISQDLINYVTKDLGCLVVAAGGNRWEEKFVYPASYDNVLSVAALRENNVIAYTYNKAIDLSAPGIAIRTTDFGGGYTTIDGSSFSAPMTCGAAALVASIFPEYNGPQLGEQLRVTADKSLYTVGVNAEARYKDRLGMGSLDIYASLTRTSPSLRVLKYDLLDSEGNVAEPGDNARLYFDITNYLQSTSPTLEITIATADASVNITRGKITPGVITGGKTVRNNATPFELTLNSNLVEGQVIDLLVTFSDGDYQDYQHISFVPNLPYRTMEENQIKTSIASAGRIGYADAVNSQGGIGFTYNGKSMLYEMGLILGSSAGDILNSVRGEGSLYDQDFVSTSQIRKTVPGEDADAEINGSFSDTDVTSEQRVQVNYRTQVWRGTPYDKFAVVEYTLTNAQATPMTDFYVGLFADWDVSAGGGQDAAGWDADTRVGYVYSKASSSLPHAGIQVLNGTPNYYAIDNTPDPDNNSFGLYDGFTDAEKFTAISSDRTTAGAAGAGADVSHVVSAGPYTLAQGESVKVAFALHGASNLTDLLASASAADELYNEVLQIPLPLVLPTEVCTGCNATLVATGGSDYNWYKDQYGGAPLATGPEFTMISVQNDTIVYVSNVSGGHESLRIPVQIRVKGATSSEGELDRRVIIFPVPVLNGKLTVTVRDIDAREFSLTVLNAQGAEMTHIYLGSLHDQFSHTISTIGYPAGIYLVKLQLDNDVIVRRVVIR